MSYLPLILAGVLGASAGSAIMSRSPAKEEPRPPQTRAQARAEAAVLASHTEWIARVRPALMLVAEHLSARTPSDRELQAAMLAAHWRAAAKRGDAKDSARTGADAVEAIQGEQKETDPDKARDLLIQRLGAMTAAPADKDTMAWQSRKDLLDREIQKAANAALLKTVLDNTVARGHAGVSLEVVIATMPDYVDSYTGWSFDHLLDALQRAAGASGLSMDRFYLPDWEPGGETASRGDGRTPQRHESEPAAVLFRDHSAKGERLVLLLMPLETATSGVHKASLLGALALARVVTRDGSTIHVLGPSYSGSSSSLVLALNEAFETNLLACSGLWPVVTFTAGSATDRTNQATIEAVEACREERSAAGPKAKLVEFSATVASDDQAFKALSSYLGGLESGWESGRGMAILTESNSGWGQSLLPKDEKKPSPSSPSAVAGPATSAATIPSSAGIIQERCRSGAITSGELDPGKPFPCAKRLTFPLHISRLRGQAALQTAGKAAPSETAAPLRSEDKVYPTDQLPALKPELSAAVVETALATTLGALNRLDVTAVGMIGSDPRDLLFLAEQVRRRKPNVLLFTLEGSLTFLHPDYRAYARGMVVASSYPLFSMTQQLLLAPAGDAPIQQFASMGGQGLYNAFLAVMGKSDKMLDYGTRCGTFASCRPDIWISQVGDDAIWPLRRTPPSDDGYTWRGPAVASAVIGVPPASADLPPALRAVATWPLMAGLGFAITLVVAAAHAWVLFRIVKARPVADPEVVNTVALAVPAAKARKIPMSLGVFEPPKHAAIRWGLTTGTERAQKLPSAEPPSAKDCATEDRAAQVREEHGMGLLACCGACLVPVFLASHIFAVGMNTGAPSGFPTILFTIAVLRFVLLAEFGVSALWLLSRGDWDWRRPWRLVRGAGVLMGLVALFSLAVSLTGSDPWSMALGGLTVQRYLLVKSLLSPLAPLVMMAVVVYGWGLWNLWRVHHQAVAHGGECAVVVLLEPHAHEAADGFLDALDGPLLNLPGREALGILAIVVIQFVAGLRNFRTTDGPWMSGSLLAGTMLATLLGAHVLAYCHGLGRKLLRALRALNLHPIGQAFSRLGHEPFLWRVSDGAPLSDQTVLLFRLADGCAESFSRVVSSLQALARRRGIETHGYKGTERRASLTPVAVEYRASLDAAAATLATELKIRHTDVKVLEGSCDRLREAATIESRRPVQASALWKEIGTWSPALNYAMRKAWRKDPYAMPTHAGDDEERKGEPKHLREAETLLALQASLAIRQVVIRLTRGLAFGVSALVLVLAAHLVYLFQGRAFWLGLDWALLGLASLLGLSLFVRMEKDAVLSRLWGTTPGQISLNGQFVQRIVMYGAIPVVSLFVTFFPEVGTSLFSWLEPLQKSLP